MSKRIPIRPSKAVAQKRLKQLEAVRSFLLTKRPVPRYAKGGWPETKASIERRRPWLESAVTVNKVLEDQRLIVLALGKRSKVLTRTIKEW